MRAVVLFEPKPRAWFNPFRWLAGPTSGNPNGMLVACAACFSQYSVEGNDLVAFRPGGAQAAPQAAANGTPPEPRQPIVPRMDADFPTRDRTMSR
jgi:hypothetical protein